MRRDIRCSACPYLIVPIRNNVSTSNVGMSRPRGCCYCNHPNAPTELDKIVPGTAVGPGFIAYTKGYSDVPNIKTAPRWCPIKLMEEPKQISKRDAYKVITNREPRGLFFVKEPAGYAGIDNMTGDAWTEDFKTKEECLRWLQTGRREDDGE